MGWFVVTALIAIASAVTLVVLATLHRDENPESRDPGFNSKPYMIGTIIAALVLFVGVTSFASTDTVPNGHIGIKKQFGSLVGTTGEGLVTHAPWQSVDEVSVQNELRTYEMTAANSAVSADSQPVFLVVQVNYSLLRDKAVPLYRETGGHFVDRILDPAVYQNTKASTASYKAIEFAKNREQIRQNIEKNLAQEVGVHGIQINNVSLKNVDFTEAFSQAIEQTVVREQEAKVESEKVKIATAQGKQKVATTRAEAESKVVAAKAAAQAIRIEAAATAYAQKLKQKTLTPLLVQMEAINKLSDNVKVIVCTGDRDCVPEAFVNVDGR